MSPLDDDTRADVRSLVVRFFAEECDADPDAIRDDTHILDELEGDSLMFLSLLELVKKKYELRVQLKTLGKYLMKHPAETVGQVVDATLLLLEHGDDIESLA